MKSILSLILLFSLTFLFSFVGFLSESLNRFDRWNRLL